MNQTKKESRVCNQLAVTSLALGLLGAILTGLVHFWFGLVTGLDLSGKGMGFFLLLGSTLAILLLGVIDLSAGWGVMYKIQHHAAHGKYAKAAALTGMSLGILDIIPAAIILAMILEMVLLQFHPLKNFFIF